MLWSSNFEPPILKTLALTTLALFGCGTSTMPLLSQIQRPVWTHDFSRDVDTNGRFDGRYFPFQVPKISFSDDKELLLSFDDTPSSQSGVHTSHFLVFAISTQDGKSNRILDIPAPPGTNEIAPTEDGGFILLSGSKLSLFSQDRKLRREIEVGPPYCAPLAPIAQERDGLTCIYNGERLKVSPTNDEVLFRDFQMPGMPVEYSWFATSDLTRSGHASSQNLGEVSAGSGFLVGQGKRSEALLLSTTGQTTLCDHCFRVFVVSDQLLLKDFSKQIELSTIDGKTLYSRSMPDGTDFFAGASKAPRFLFVTYGMGLQRFGIPIGPRNLVFHFHIMDYQLVSQVGEVIYKQPLSRDPTFTPGASQSAVALSPDGKSVALLDGGSLALYRLGH